MMLVTGNKVFASHKFETRRTMMAAIARAIFEKSPPLADDGEIHREYRADHKLFGAEVDKYFVGEELVMFFPKGRNCMVHLRPDPTSPKAIIFNGDLFDDTYEERLERHLGRAQQILNRIECV